MSDSGIVFYGADWCRDCRRSKAFLDGQGIGYRYVDVAESKAAADEAMAVSGRPNIPVIVFKDGSHVVEPSDEVLAAKLAAV